MTRLRETQRIPFGGPSHAAVSEANVSFAHRYRNNGKAKEIPVRGRYLNEWARHDGRPAIAAHRYVEDFCDAHDVDDHSGEAPRRRDPINPSDSLFASHSAASAS